MLKGNDEKAMEQYKSVYSLLNNDKKKAICENNLACICLRMKEFTEQKIFSKKSIDHLSLLENENDVSLSLKILIFIGI